MKLLLNPTTNKLLSINSNVIQSSRSGKVLKNQISGKLIKMSGGLVKEAPSSQSGSATCSDGFNIIITQVEKTPFYFDAYITSLPDYAGTPITILMNPDKSGYVQYLMYGTGSPYYGVKEGTWTYNSATQTLTISWSSGNAANKDFHYEIYS